jgi:hypothetical protein
MRGGSRKGAGRKRLIEDEFSRLGIGGKCEELWRNEWEAAREHEIAHRLKTVRKEYQKLHSIPVRSRKEFWRGAGANDYKEDIEYALQEDQGLSDEKKPARYVEFDAKRPKGKKKAIIEAIAKAETEERGIRISARYVQKCWDDWRAIRADDLREQEEEEKQYNQNDNEADF